jgi:putative flippase GtrA
LIRQLIGFVLAGGVATVLNFLLFLVLLELRVHVTVAAAIGYVSGIAVSFAINKLWIFKDAQKASVLRYFIAYGIALAAQLGLLNVFLSVGLPPELANAAAIGIVVVLNYFLVRKFVFGR